MITFVPSWSGVSSGQFSTDDLIGPIQALQSSNEPFRILVRDYLPNLRYFLHRFGLLESDYVSIFDTLQNFKGYEQRALKIEDLDFPGKVHYVYTPFSVLVFQEKKKIGEIIMAEGAHISEVHHYNNQDLVSIEIYDDRGFLSSRRIYEEGRHFLTEYLDSSQQCVFIHFQDDGSCAVNYNNTHGLLRKYYENLEDLVFECVEKELRRKGDENIILSVDDKSLSQVSRNTFLENMVVSYFENRIKLNKEVEYYHRFLVSKTKGVLVDSQKILNKLSSLTENYEKIHKISPFDTRFLLSMTQEMKEEVLYLDMRKTNFFEDQGVINQLFEYVCERMFEEERIFKIYIRSEFEKKNDLESYYHSLLQQNFSEELTVIEEVDLEEGGENTFEDTLLGTIKTRISVVKQLQECFKVEVFKGDEELFKILQQSRILIDLSLLPDLFTQIAGISSGIPQLNRVKTDYVQNEENGEVLQSQEDLTEALIHYLDSLKYWQEARVHSVQKIKLYSGVILNKKIQNLFKEK